MLKILLSIVLVISNTSQSEDDEFVRYLDAPELVSVTPVDPPGLYIHWAHVKYAMRDPVIGYKIRIYEIPVSSEKEVKLINEKYSEFVRTDIPLQKFSSNDTYLPTKEIVVSEKIYKTTVNDLKYNTLYEVRILAFKIDVDGPLSEPIRIKMLNDTDYHAVVTRTPTGCQISVPRENVEIADNSFPFIHNSYF